MTQEGYATRPLLFCPGMNLSQREKERMDNYEIKIEELTADHVIYSMSRQIENNFQVFYKVAEDIVGEEKALEIANEVGRRYGGTGYAKLLKAYGAGDRGSPRMMALYQDLVHAIRGPKHTAALFAEYDDERCTVRRDRCIYFSEAFPELGKYGGAFETGCCEGYLNADKNMIRIDNPRCRWKGDGTCEHNWVFKRS